jgi:hypothetical protein
MNTQKPYVDHAADEKADELLSKLMHLKRYERPAAERMVRNRQNIMRLVREEKRKDWGLGDLLELNMPWFFAEPRYGIALLFVVFAGLQFVGVSTRKPVRESKDAVYSSPSSVALIDQAASVSSNVAPASLVDENMRLFSQPDANSTVHFVGLLQPDK